MPLSSYRLTFGHVYLIFPPRVEPENTSMSYGHPIAGYRQRCFRLRHTARRKITTDLHERVV